MHGKSGLISRKSLLFLFMLVSTQLQPDLVLWFNLEKVVNFVDLSVPWEDRVEETYDLEKARYSKMVGEAAR